MKQEWVVSIRAQCDRSGTAVFFKQWGGRSKKAAGRDLEGVLHDAFPTPRNRRMAMA